MNEEQEEEEKYNGVRTIASISNQIKEIEDKKNKDATKEDLQSSSGGSDSDPSDGELKVMIESLTDFID